MTTTLTLSSIRVAMIPSGPATWLSAGLLSLLLSAGAARAQAPTVTSLVPTRNAVAAPRNTPVAVTFDQPLSNNTSTQQALKVFSQQAGGQKAGTATVSGNTLTFSPAASFKPGETVYATVTAAAQSATGTAATPHVFQFTTATAPAPASFSGSTDLSVGRAPGSVATGDVDGDGDLDLLTANDSGNTVSVRLNDGQGSFSAGREVSVAGSAAAEQVGVTLGDLDGDGDLDLLSNSSTSSLVSVRVNDGTGTFTGNQQVAISGAVFGVTVGDVDGDGDLDLLTANGGGGTVSVRLNDGSGTFSTTGQTIAVGDFSVAVAVGDVDKDGDLDLLAANLRTVSVRLNNGLGSFGGGSEVPMQVPQNLVLGDLDGDGDLDLLAANYYGSYNSVSVRFNNGSGSFSGGQEVAVGGSPNNLALGDVDGDGDLDFMTANTGSNSSSVRLNNGSGSFSAGQEVLVSPAPKGVALGDLDGDGDLDLLTTGGTASGLVSVRLNQAAALLVTAVSPPPNARSVPRTMPVTVSFDKPLSNTAATQQALSVFSSQAGGKKTGTATVSGNTLTFSPTISFKPGETVSATVTKAAQNSGGQNLATPQVFQFTTAVAPSTGVFGGGSELSQGGGIIAGDVDGDGDLDLFTNSGIYLNTGNGTFVAGPRSYGGPVAGDLDGDGDLDYVSATGSEAGVEVSLNNGNATFISSTAAIGSYRVSAALGDVDGDGDLDIVAGDGEATGVSVGLNDGRGSFRYGGYVSVPLRLALIVALGDVDNDGDLDLLVTASGSNQVSVRLNNGAGSFSGGQEIAVGSGPVNVKTGDVDGDGDLDLLTVNTGDNTVSVRLNNGSGSFSGGQEVNVGTKPVAVDIGDVDGDGDLDFVTANSADNTASVCLNDGSGRFPFVNNQQVSVGSRPRNVALGDVDGDGTLDLVTANYNTTSVRLNQSQALPLPVITSLAATVSSVGNSIRIAGTGFVYVKQVTINGVAATVDPFFSSPTQLTVFVPAGATTGPVVVTTSAGVSNSVLLTLVPPLRVLAVAPGRNAPAAPRTAPVAVSFNRALRSSPANQTALSVFSQQAGGKKTGLTSISTNTLTFKPATDFRPGETVYATVGAVQGADSAVAPPYVFQFTTATSPGGGVFSGGSDLLVGAGPVIIATGDVDGDGDLDLLSSNGYANTVRVRLNDGSGSFSGTQEVSVGSSSFGYPSTIVPGDIDGDGDLDLLTADDTSVSVRLNNGAGSFSSAPAIPLAGPAGKALLLADVDGDGDLDLLTANASAVSVRLNNGNGTFSSNQEVGVKNAPSAIAVGDVDNDGDLDLLAVSSNFSGGTVSIRLNNGLGSFTAGPEVAVGNSPASLVVGDVDNDGDLDLLTANNYDFSSSPYDGKTVSVRLNDGRGSFSGTQEVPVGLRPGRLALGDVDGDGDLDLLTTNAASGTASVRLNSGSGLFSGSQEVAVGSSPTGLAVVDVDNDGDLDLLTANSSGSMSVRLDGYHVLAAAAGALTAPLSVYPNPTRGSCTLTYSASKAQAATLSLTDQLGRVVQQQAVQLRAGTNQVPVEATSLSAGLYQLTLRLADGQRRSQKLLVQP